MTSEDVVMMEILAVAERRAQSTPSSTSTATATSIMTGNPPSVVTADFENIGGTYFKDTPFVLSWNIPLSGDSWTFTELHLFQDPSQSADPENSYNVSTGFNLSLVNTLILFCPLDSVRQAQCSPAGIELGITSNTGSVNVTFLDEIPGPRFYFGLKYSTGDDSTDFSYFYSHFFQIEEKDEIAAGTSSTITTSSSSSTTDSIGSPFMTGNSGPSSSTLASTTSFAAVSPHGGLTTGAKVGIAIGTVGGVLIILIAALLLWRRSKMRQVYSNPPAGYASQDLAGDRNLHAEKEMNIISTVASPYEEVQSYRGMAAVPAVTQPRTDERNSWAEGQVNGSRDLGRESYHDHDVAVPPQVPTPPPNQAYSTSQEPAIPVTTEISRLHEPGMGPEELARLEEEERRLDEAIAEAERRRA